MSNIFAFWIKKKIKKLRILKTYYSKVTMPHNKGFCNICEQNVSFYEFDKWLRDSYQCNKCGSIPRNRALINTLNLFYPNWKGLKIHESSPGGALSDYLKKNENYSASHYYEDFPRGHFKDGFRSEDLSALTFDDETFDLFVTSDVFEHIMEPEKAFREIARVLKPGGAHVFTMPWYPELRHTRQRACVKDDKPIFLLEPIYHGNPISEEGSLVTYDWGRDVCNKIFQYSEMFTTIYLEKNRAKGLDAEFLEVFISLKSSNAK